MCMRIEVGITARVERFLNDVPLVAAKQDASVFSIRFLVCTHNAKIGWAGQFGRIVGFHESHMDLLELSIDCFAVLNQFLLPRGQLFRVGIPSHLIV